MGTQAYGRESWLGEEDLVITHLHMSQPPGFCTFHCTSAHSLRFLLGFAVNPKQETEFLFHLQSGIRGHTGPEVVGLR